MGIAATDENAYYMIEQTCTIYALRRPHKTRGYIAITNKARCRYRLGLYWSRRSFEYWISILLYKRNYLLTSNIP